MTTSIRHTNVRGASITVEQEARLFEQMRRHGREEELAYASMSGADVAGAPMYGIMRNFYVLIWEGVSVEDALSDCEARWRSYAAENNSKVEAAAKWKDGPRKGHSVIDHRWTDPERFLSYAIYLRTMVSKILGA